MDIQQEIGFLKIDRDIRPMLRKSEKFYGKVLLLRLALALENAS